MALLIALIIIIGISISLKRKIFFQGHRENRDLILFIITTGILGLFSYVLACCTLGSLIYFSAIFNYIVSVIDIYKVVRLLKANDKKESNC